MGVTKSPFLAYHNQALPPTPEDQGLGTSLRYTRKVRMGCSLKAVRYTEVL